MDFPTDHAPVLALALSPNYADDGVLFAGTEANGFFRSDDRGHTWTRLGQRSVTQTVNAVVVSPEFPVKADVLVMSGDTLLISRDGGESWADWKAAVNLGAGGACAAAPQGLDPGAPLLIGLVEGGVLRV
ncbi:MAG: WD40/YVTN/BNR-like repeat-containing protein [Anaerolineae bacterium]